MNDDSTGTSGQSEKDRDRLTDDSIIDDQFDEFLSRLELLESEDYNGVDDEDLDYSIKERVMMIKLEKIGVRSSTLCNSYFTTCPLSRHITASYYCWAAEE